MSGPYTKTKPVSLAAALGRAMPQGLAGRLPSPELLRAWDQIMGPVAARRARPVCLELDGTLVVAVRGAVWKQELSLAWSGIRDQLRQAGVQVGGLRLANLAYEPPPPEPPPATREATPREEAMVAAQLEHVRDPGVRQALASLMRAMLTSRTDPDR